MIVSLGEKMEDDVSIALAPSAGQGRGGKERKTRISKRGRLGEGRPTKRTPEVVARIAGAIAIGLKAHWRKKVNPPLWDIL